MMVHCDKCMHPLRISCMYVTFVALASMGNDMWSIGKSSAHSTFVTSAVKCTQCYISAAIQAYACYVMQIL